MRVCITILTWLGAALSALAQGPYSLGSDGVAHSLPVFEGWITEVVDVSRPVANSGGYARDESGGLTNAPILDALVGRPTHFGTTGAVSHVVSLGNGGSITVGFDAPITNGDGPDFAVFENGFIDVEEPYVFAELAFVEVATTTSNWARFDTAYLNDEVLYALNNTSMDWYASQDVTQLDGFAGKHLIGQGTPFDLAGLTNHPAVLSGEVDLGNIRYIRITDVIGDGSTQATDGNDIYDPYYHFIDGYPNPAGLSSTDGFDLRAVGVIHHQVHLEIDAAGVHWMGRSNATYQLQFKGDWTDNWQDLGSPVAGAGSLISQPHSNVLAQLYQVMKTK